jgi:DNA-binding response OmpR family regulator
MRVVAIDDDVEELELIKSTVHAIGHECHVFTGGAALQRELRRETFDLLIVDWQLPDTTGPDIVRWVRSNLKERIPILFVTNRRQERDIVEGLGAGADDFMMKPVRVGELAARVKALLRRSYLDPRSEEQVWGRYRFLCASRRLEINGEPVVLTQKEFDLALILFRNMGRLLSRQYLLEAIWSVNNPLGTDLMSRSLDTHISRVRSLLGLRPENGFRLAAIYGQGYRFEAIGTDDSGAF